MDEQQKKKNKKNVGLSYLHRCAGRNLPTHSTISFGALSCPLCQELILSNKNFRLASKQMPLLYSLLAQHSCPSEGCANNVA